MVAIRKYKFPIKNLLIYQKAEAKMFPPSFNMPCDYCDDP
jgi:hypothetical protein